jgi:Zn-dependent M28 family amino/carboxypeptidase
LAAARDSHWALDRLEDLTDLVGPRLSGSAGAAAAVEQVAAALRAQGLVVRLEPVKVPHWERGLEQGELVDYAGHPAGLSQKIELTALGGSGATPAAGITAPVLVVHDFADLEKLGARVKGAIVLFDTPFPPGLVEHGQAGSAYGATIPFRFAGPARAAAMGASAALIRSLGSADFRIPHTGATLVPKDQPPLPAAAVTSEDAQLISRLSRRGQPVLMHLTLTPRVLPDVDSFNVIADLPGTDPTAGIVLVSGHLDSWDLATGAIDDGAGVVAAMGAIQLIHAQDLHPRRTIRFVAWMNEENGGRGGESYGKQHAAELASHVAAIESDAGAGHPTGVITNVPLSGGAALEPLLAALRPAGLGNLEQLVRPLGSDLEAIERAGAPVYEPQVDGRHYFDLHHTPADTFDKVDPADFKDQVGLMAALAWYLADQAAPPPRLPPLPSPER